MDGSQTIIPPWVPIPAPPADTSIARTSAGTIGKTKKKQSDVQATVAGAGSCIPVAYGFQRLGGRIFVCLVRGPTLYLGVAWCIGEIDAIVSVEINDTAIPQGVDVANYTGTDTQVPDPWLVTAYRAQGKVYDDDLKGIAYSVLRVNAGVKLSGFPRVNATLRGMKIRTTETGPRVYSQVGAYIIADFVESSSTDDGYGMGEVVDWDSVARVAAWNNSNAGGEVRQITNMLVDSVQPVDTWLANMCDSASCFAIRNGGEILLIPDAPVDPAEFVSIGPPQIVANTLSIATRDSTQTPTVVQVTYTDTSRSPWQSVPTDPATLPGVADGTKLRRMSKLDKQGIQRHSEAYRYAVQRLNVATVSDLTFTAQLFDAALELLPGMVLSVTHPLGLSAKWFRLMKCESPSPGRWNVSGEEYDPAEYSDVVVSGPTTDDTTLPNPSLPPAITGLTSTEDLVQTLDGLYNSRIRVSWDTPTFPYIANYRIDIYEGSQTGGTLVCTADFSNQPYVTPSLKEHVSYTAVVHIVSTTGAVGPDATTTIIPQGKFLPPADVPNFNGFEAGGRVYLSWAIAVDIAMDTIRYEIRYGAVGVIWDNAARLDRVSALTWASQGMAAGTYRFLIKALDSVNNYSINAAYKDITVTLDTSAYSAYTYKGSDLSAVYVAMREMVDSTTNARAAITDFGDGWEYGEATQRNDVGTFGLAATVTTQPHRSALMFGGDPTNGRYVSVPYVAAYNAPLTYTIEQRIYCGPVPVSGALWSRMKAGDNTTGVAAYVTAGRQIQIDKAGAALVRTNETVPQYKWTKITTQVTAGTVALFIDDVPCTYAVNTTPGTYPPNNNTGPLLIGAYLPPSSIYPLPGLIRDTKFWNKALTLAQMKVSSQYPNDPTAIGGLIGAWTGNDGVQGATTTVYADVSATANPGAVVIAGAGWTATDWRSFSRALTSVIDLGDVLNGTFTMSGGNVLSLAGDVAPLMRISVDGVTYSEYPNASVTTSGRYFQVGYESQGGSMLVQLSSLVATVLVVPRTETGTIACLTTGIQSVLLKNLYAKVTDLQLTPDATTGTPAAVYGAPDSIELNSVGIPGGFQLARLCNAAQTTAAGAFTFTSFGWGNTVTLESILKLPTPGRANSCVPFEFQVDANQTYRFELCDPNSAQVARMITPATTVFTLNGVAAIRPAADRAIRVTYVLNGTVATLYYNGVLMGTCVVNPITSTVARPCFVGAALTSGTPFCTGYMYDVRVWNIARAQADIAATAFVRVDPATPGLVAYWKMDGNPNDATANARNLTAVQTVTYRPVNGFDVYAFNNAGARVAANMRWRFSGA